MWGRASAITGRGEWLRGLQVHLKLSACAPMKMSSSNRDFSCLLLNILVEVYFLDS